MMNFLIQWAIRQRYLVCFTVAVLLLLSAWFIPKINLDAFPDVTNVQVSINTQAPSFSAKEVEQLISQPIESGLYSLPGVSEVRSISKNGLSGVTVIFAEGTDIYRARQLVFEQLQQIQSVLPQGIDNPVLGPNTSGLGQIYQYRLYATKASGVDNRQLRSLNDWVVKQLLMPIEGITEILSFGGEVKQFDIALDPNKLRAYDLTAEDVSAAVVANNISVGGWFLEQGATQNVIRGDGWITSQNAVNELRLLPIKTTDGHAITIADVATVRVGSEPRVGAVTMSIKDKQNIVSSYGEIVTGIVLKRLGANTYETIADIKAKIETINQALPQGVYFEPIYDQANLVSTAIHTITQALFIAFMLVVIVLFSFLLDLTATLLVLCTIPIAIALALMVMSLFGLSANLMSLGGLAIALGMLVDGSVVVVENILKHKKDSQSKKDVFFTATIEVAKPVFIASLMILLVFTPLFSFEGVEAKLFEPMAIAIILAIISALLVALIFIPAAASLLLHRNHLHKNHRPRTNTLFDAIERKFQRLLLITIRFKKRILTSALLFVVCCGYLFTTLGSEFIPKLEEGTLNIRVTLAPSSNLDTALALAPKLESELLKFDVVESVISRIGRAELGGDPEPINNIELYVLLKPRSQWPPALNRTELQSQMQTALDQFPGILLNFSQPIETRVDELLSGVKSQIAVKIYGNDLDVLAKISEQLAKVIEKIPGTTDVAPEQMQNEYQLVISPKRDVLSQLGLTVDSVMKTVNTGLAGVNVSQIYEHNARINISLRYLEEFRNSEFKIARLPIRLPNGGWVELQNVATVQMQLAPSQIRRDGLARRVVIGVNVINRDMGSVVNDIEQNIIKSKLLPKGYYFTIGGQYENQQRAQQRLIIIVPIVVTVIALLLYLVFKSWQQTLLVLSSLPFAAGGGVLALFISNQYLSVPSAIGFITVFGIAVLNGVVLVESINQRLSNGHHFINAIIKGTSARLKPVLMTATTTLLGLIPMLTASDLGAEIQKPLATVIVGGIVTSTLLTLIVIPILFTWITRHEFEQTVLMTIDHQKPY